ncbi:carbamoyltransferase, partial [bacterium]|nr:carbamoyltransferase [bacterium]
RKLCLAGGVALNCNMNAALRELPFVDDIFVQPGAMDMGTAIGAALEAYAQLGYCMKDKLEQVSYGLEYSDETIKSAIENTSFAFKKVDDVVKVGAQLLADDEIIGWFQGCMEFGPRALGNRSILANPTKYETRDKVNKIKKRELWRPLAPSILEEDMIDWFENPYPTPFMTLNLRFKKDVQEKVPAVVHIDGTARVQSVNIKNNELYYKLIKKFKEKTGIPILLNTSFNSKGEPIVCSPEDALRTFENSPLKHLLISSYHVTKK